MDYKEHRANFAQYKLTKIKALQDTQYARVAYNHYVEFAYCRLRSNSAIQDLMKTLIP